MGLQKIHSPTPTILISSCDQRTLNERGEEEALKLSKGREATKKGPRPQFSSFSLRIPHQVNFIHRTNKQTWLEDLEII